MKPAFFAKVVALAAIANVPNASAAGEVEEQLVELLKKHLANFEAIMNAEIPVVSDVGQKLVAGFQPVTLTGSTIQSNTLQPSTGLGSNARGLTSADDWRRMFPRKGQP